MFRYDKIHKLMLDTANDDLFTKHSQTLMFYYLLLKPFY